jgi:hypothetical protein
LDAQGFVSRHLLSLEEGGPKGLAALFDVRPLDTSHWDALATPRDLTIGYRISIPTALELLDGMLRYQGESIEDGFQAFEEQFGLRLKEDVLDYLDGSILVQGNLDSADPASSWIVQIGLSDEMSFFESFEEFNARIAEIADDEGGARLLSQDVDGTLMYTLDSDPDFVPDLSWCLHGGRLCIALDAPTLTRWMTSGEPTIRKDAAVQQALNDAESCGLSDPLSLTRIDLANVIRLVMSMSSMFAPAMEDAPFRLSDLPPVDVLVNGVEPSVSLVFRTDDGFEVYSRQTIPGAAPGASLAAIGGLGLPAILQTRAHASRAVSMNNLRQLMIGLHNYHDVHMSFPAKYNQDKDGKPLLSWRVHILPYLDEQELYDEFHLDEPWDSEHNLKLVEKMPVMFENPRLKLEPGKTAYVAPIGANTIWKSPQDDKQTPTGMRLEQILDGTSNTIALIEIGEADAVIWTKPDDLNVDPEGFAEKFAKAWKGGGSVAMADASVHALKPDISPDQWWALFGARDGTVIEVYELRAK